MSLSTSQTQKQREVSIQLCRDIGQILHVSENLLWTTKKGVIIHWWQTQEGMSLTPKSQRTNPSQEGTQGFRKRARAKITRNFSYNFVWIMSNLCRNTNNYKIICFRQKTNKIKITKILIQMSKTTKHVLWTESNKFNNNCKSWRKDNRKFRGKTNKLIKYLMILHRNKHSW